MLSRKKSAKIFACYEQRKEQALKPALQVIFG
jgi:hypothetical protein